MDSKEWRAVSEERGWSGVKRCVDSGVWKVEDGEWSGCNKGVDCSADCGTWNVT